jgi:alkylation response protein AidB-like acyl-CoA dehydrogenase
VHFQPTQEQRALQAAVRELCKRRDGRPGWAELAELGVFDLRRPVDARGGTAAAGAGLGMAEAVLVFEELGRALVPGPLVGTHLAVTHVDGQAPAGRAGVAERAAGPVLVEHLAGMTDLYVLDDDGITRLDPRALDATPVPEPVDPLTPLARVAGLPPGDAVTDRAGARTWRREGAVLTAAFQLGICTAVLERSVAYAREREQFGRPIGSFQAVKHMLADMLVREQVTRAAVYAAAVTLDDPGVGDRAAATASAKLLADEAAEANVRAAVQVHGGVGFTWEAGLHLYLKRTWVLACTFGTADEHAAARAGRLGADRLGADRLSTDRSSVT